MLKALNDRSDNPVVTFSVVLCTWAKVGEEDVLKEIQRISLCDLDDNCDKPYCLRKDNGCVLLIPRSHLLNPKIDNEELVSSPYVLRFSCALSDEQYERSALYN